MDLNLKTITPDFPGGLVVKHPPSNAGDAGQIPGRGTKIPHAVGQLSPHAATTEPSRFRARVPQLESPHAATTEPACSGARAPQLERGTTTKSLCATTEDPTCHNEDPTCRN